jgi:hypothetical protein
MTYDYLYKKIEGLWHDSYKSPEMTALWDIVKLHKPFDLPWEITDLKGCDGCGHIYPCDTIDTILKSLG